MGYKYSLYTVNDVVCVPNRVNKVGLWDILSKITGVNILLHLGLFTYRTRVSVVLTLGPKFGPVRLRSQGIESWV